MRVKDDFASIPIPQGKDPKKYTIAERRAEEYAMLMKAGTFRVLHMTKLAERYGLKSHNSIARDRRVLQAYLRDTLTSIPLVPNVILKKQWALRQAMDHNDYREVERISESILQTSFELGIITKSPEAVIITEDPTLAALLKKKKSEDE